VRIFFEEGADDAPLNAFPSAVDQTDFLNVKLNALIDVFFNDTRDVLGRKGMKIQPVFDRKYYGLRKR
jgi:hypothetical protein